MGMGRARDSGRLGVQNLVNCNDGSREREERGGREGGTEGSFVRKSEVLPSFFKFRGRGCCGGAGLPREAGGIDRERWGARNLRMFLRRPFFAPPPPAFSTELTKGSRDKSLTTDCFQIRRVGIFVDLAAPKRAWRQSGEIFPYLKTPLVFFQTSEDKFVGETAYAEISRDLLVVIFLFLLFG